jgi:hypothetical protein
MQEDFNWNSAIRQVAEFEKRRPKKYRNCGLKYCGVLYCGFEYIKDFSLEG